VSGFVLVLGRRGERIEDSVLRKVAAPLASHGAGGLVTRRIGDERVDVGAGYALSCARDGAAAGPLRDAAGTWLAADVRLDGREELRRALESQGVRVTPNDTDEALVLAAWRAWGEHAASRLRGDFSFALWDATTRVLYCARDAMGVRPLYFAASEDAFVCSNSLAAVRAHPAAGVRLHEPALVSFLQCGYNTDLSSTTFADVRRLPPGHQMVVRGDGPVEDPRRHWDFPHPHSLTYRRGEEYEEHFRAVLGEAVRDRVRVPRVALLLSGGLDSTTLAATLRQVAPEAEVLAITTSARAVLPDDDEARLAGLVAHRLQMRHEVIDDVPEPFGHLDEPGFGTPEPFDDPTLGGWRRLAARMAAFAPVAFMGEDGDALFAPPGLVTMLRTRGAWDVLPSVARHVMAHGRPPYLGLWLRERLGHFGRRAPGSPPEPVPWLRSAVVERYAVPCDRPKVTQAARPEVQASLSTALWQSLHDGCGPEWSGAALEMRWPLLDTRVLEFALAIPPVPWCQHKALVRSAFRRDLPLEVLARKKSPLHGYSEWQVARWRSRWDGRLPPLHARVAALVDPAQVLPRLRSGTTGDALAALRVIVLNQWLEQLDAAAPTRWP
jgi:asparagine synthase (glutamine-hydrolysing)